MGSSFNHLIRTDSNEFFLMAEEYSRNSALNGKANNQFVLQSRHRQKMFYNHNQELTHNDKLGERGQILHG